MLTNHSLLRLRKVDRGMGFEPRSVCCVTGRVPSRDGMTAGSVRRPLPQMFIAPLSSTAESCTAYADKRDLESAVVKGL